MIKELDAILYDDGSGIFADLRRGNFSKNEIQLEKIRQFAKRLNREIREGRGDPREVLYIVAIVHDLFIFAEAGWTVDFATEIYETVNYAVD